MSKHFLQDIDLNQNQILKGAFERLASAPGSPVLGQFYFNTGDNKFYGWNGTIWCDLCVTGAGDDLGNHIATQILAMAGYDIENIGRGFFSDGTIANPAITFKDGTGTGVHREATGDMAFIVDGLEIFELQVDGRIIVSGAVSNYHTLVTADNVIPNKKYVNLEDTAAKDRANHTGTQLASTVSDFDSAADARITAQAGNANGLATLDGGGKVPASQLPLELMEFKGNWNASTDSPSLADTDTGAQGNTYRVSVAGTHDFGAGNITFGIGDWVTNNGTIWEKGDNNDEVTSVAGKTGVVTLDADDVAEVVNKRYMTDAQETKLDSAESNAKDDQTDSEIETAYNNQVAVVTQGDAEAGTSTDVKRWTAQRVKQAIDALGGSSYPEYQYSADELDSPNNSDWPVNALAPVATDSVSNALKVRRFDDTTDEAVGFLIRVPSGATNMVVKLNSRAQTAPGSSKTVSLKLQTRGIPNNAAVESWASVVEMINFTMPTNTYFQKDSQSISLSSLGMTAGGLEQVTLYRDGGDAGDTLVGDWTLLSINISFT